MADINKSVEVKFESNADQVKNQVDELLSSLDKISNEYEDLERSLRDVVNAEQKLIQSEQKLTEQLGRTKGATASIEEEVRKNTIAYQNKVRELDNVRQRYSKVDESSQKLNTSTRTLTSSVSSNGGAMGLLSELTGGLAMTFKDAGEATELFGNKLSGLKGALIASGIGLAVVIIGELIANWEKWSGAIDGSTQKLKDLNLELNITKSLNSEAFEQMATDLKLMEARGATEQEILNFKKKNRDEYIKRLNEEYQKELDIYKQNKDNSLEAQKAINDKRDAVGVKIREYDTELEIAQILINKKKTEEETTKELERKKKIQDEYNKGLLSAQQIAEQVKQDNLKNSQTEYEQLEEKYKKDKALLEKYNIDVTQLEIKYMNDINNLKLKEDEVEKKRKDDRLKSLTDLLNKSKIKEKEYSDAKTFDEVNEIYNRENLKLIAQKESDILKAQSLGATEEDIKNIKAYYDQLDINNQKGKSDAELKIKSYQTEEEVRIENQKNEAIATTKQNLNNIISSIETSGLEKTKAGQAISKTLAVTQIGIDSAVAVSKASTLANAEGVAAQLAFPTVPGAGTVARVVSYASTYAQVVANIMRAKRLLSGGGTTSTSSTGGGSSANIPASAAPNVSFVSSNENQVASSIARTTGEQPPLRAYVVSGDVTTAQSLDRNLVNNSSLG